MPECDQERLSALKPPPIVSKSRVLATIRPLQEADCKGCKEGGQHHPEGTSILYGRRRKTL